MSSNTPTVRKQANGGVAVPLTMTKNKGKGKEPVRDPQVAWKGPKPESNVDEPFGRGSSKQLKAGAPAFTPSTAQPQSTISFLNEGSTPDAGHPLIVNGTTASGSSKAPVGDNKVIGPIGSGDRQASPYSKVFFTGDVGNNVHLAFPGGHYVKMERIERGDYDNGMLALCNQYSWQEGKLKGQKSPPSGNTRYMSVLLRFDDLRDAATAADDVAVVRPNWQVSFISQAEFAASGDEFGTQDVTNPFDGQVVFSAKWHGDLKDINTDGLTQAVKELAAEYGEVLAFAEMSMPNTQAVEYRVEYYKIGEAQQVLDLLTDVQPCMHNDWIIVSKKYSHRPSTSPDTPHRRGGRPDDGLFFSPTGRSAWKVKDGVAVPQPGARSVPKVDASQVNDYYNPQQRGRFHSAPDPQVGPSNWNVVQQPRANSWAAGEETGQNEPQVVNLERIEAGQDVRTTLMLRNIPNRWTCHDLKRVLDASSFGQYDFSYLRIDFHYNTNVGYAFVNFINADAIVPFVEMYVGRDWNQGYSRRTAQVSYATVQGYDCLVEKFRNSAIMDEFEDFVPKLWWTQDSAPDNRLIGKEKTFPGPNNSSKKQRSSDNAGQIGLFAPRSGNRGSAERVRRSNFDRGTPRQIQEDAAYDAQQPPVQTGWAHGQPGFYPHGPVGMPFQPNPYHYAYQAAPMPHMPFDFSGMHSGYAQPYYQPLPFYPGMPGYPPRTYNPASQLRTATNGLLGGPGPRSVVVGDTTSHYLVGGGQQAHVPRTFANGSPANGSQAADHSADDAPASVGGAQVQQYDNYEQY